MALTLKQRLDRIAVRLQEVYCWRERAAVAINDWTFDGAPLNLGQFWPTREGAHRLRALAAAPDSWPLTETRLVLDLGGEALVKLVHGNGDVMQQGNDPYHREFPVKSHGFSIDAEVVARLPFGEPVREPRLNAARVMWLDIAVDAFHQRVSLVQEAALKLGEHEVVPHLIAAAEQALLSLDWPSSTQDYVARFAPHPQQQKIWELPKLKADPAALNDAQRKSVLAADKALVTRLHELQKHYPPQGKIALTGHAHIDLAWLWPYNETRRKMRRTFSTAVALMDQEGPSASFRFNQSTAHFYQQMAEDDPALLEAIKAKVKEGGWETVGGMWVEPDTTMPAGESLVRQLLYGQLYFEREFGQRHKVCWLPDCFGFSASLPQMLRQAGIESFFTHKVVWNETNSFPYDLFWWQGLDGTKVLTHAFHNPRGGYNGIVGPEAHIATWRNFKQKVSHDETLLAVGYGDGGGGVSPEMLQREKMLRDFPVLPAARWATVEGFFDRALATAAEKKLPTWAGEIYLEMHRATFTTQSATKKAHRQAERALVTAEALGALATLLGAEAPESLEHIWRVVLKNEFHDILPGSSIAEVYEDAERELNDAHGRALARQQMALSTIVKRLPDGELADALVVVNPSLHRRPLRVRTTDGGVYSTPDTVAPLGIRVFARSELKPLAGLSVSETHIENAHLRVEIGKDGAVSRLIHKATGRDALAGRGNQLWVYTNDKPRHYDAWDVEDDYAEKAEELTKPESIKVSEDTATRAAIRVVKRFRASTITQTYVLEANGTRLDIVTEIDWHDRHCLLRTLTPVAVHTAEATFEHAHGVVNRATHDNTSWEAAQFEVPAHRFIDMSEPGFGVALLNDAKYGHSAKGNVLGLSLVRGPVFPDPLADEGGQRFTYALYPHAGEWYEGHVREEAEDLNQPLLASTATGLAAVELAPLKVEGIPAALSGLKGAEDGNGLIFRVYEPSGRRGDFHVAPAEGWTTSGPLNILEEPMERRHATDLGPFEVRTWRLSKM